jgi:tetratricopeptide (TPR) repeat protein
LIVELVTHLCRAGFVRARKGEAEFRPRWEVEVPGETLARFRDDAQGEGSAARFRDGEDPVLTSAAVMMGAFTLRDVVALGCEEVQARQAIQRGLEDGVLARVETSERLEFSCPLLRDARVAALSAAERRRLGGLAVERVLRDARRDDMRTARLWALAGGGHKAIAAYEAAGRDRARSEREQLEAWWAAVELYRSRASDASGLARALLEKCARLRRTYPDPTSQAEALEGVREAVTLSEAGPAALRGDARILLARAIQGREPAQAEAMLESVLADLGEGGTTEEDRVRGLAHMQMGVVLRMRHPERAKTHLEAARPLLEKAEEWDWLASVWLSLGLIAQAESRARDAVHCGIQALRVARSHDLLDRYGSSCNNLAWVFIEQRPRPRLALCLIDAALPQARLRRNRDLIANLLLNRGLCSCYLGELQQAELDYVPSRREFELLGNRAMAAVLWYNLAEVQWMQGVPQRAEGSLQMSQAAFGSDPMPSSLEAEMRLHLGMVRLQQGRYEEAEEQFRQSAAQSPPGERTLALARQAWARFRRCGLDAETTSLLSHAEAEGHATSLKGQAETSRIQARCLASQAGPEQRTRAEQLYRRALLLFERSRTAAWSVADVHLGLGLHLASDPKSRTEARGHLQSALDAFIRMEEFGVSRKTARARKAMEELDAQTKSGSR